jgi:hypothetical protein
MVDALAACIGITIAAGLDWTIRQSRRSNPSAP